MRGIDALSTSYAVKIGDNTPNYLFVVQNNGNVGIATSSPLSRLNVFGTSGTSELLLYAGPNRSAFTSAYSLTWIDNAQHSITTRNTSAGRYAAFSAVKATQPSI